MRFSVILTGTFAAVAMAQATPAPSASSGTPTTASAPTSVGMTPQQSSALACLDRCRADDVNCRAACNGVPFPNDGQVNSTTTCVADCSKQFGKGTEADNAQFIKCTDGCISRNYWNPSSGTPNPTSNSGGNSNGNNNGGNSNTNNNNGNSGTRTTGGTSGTATGTSGTATGSSAADIIRVGSSVAGVFGIMAAIMAL